jgi:glycerol uptake facilitator-like aquaporin
MTLTAFSAWEIFHTACPRGEKDMREIPIHYLAILGAAAAKMAIGALWYSPALFLKRWLKLSGVTEEQMKDRMAKALAVEFVGSLLMAFVLLHAVRYAGAPRRRRRGWPWDFSTGWVLRRWSRSAL